MIVYKDYVTFTILKDSINLYHSETVYGPSTVAEFNDSTMFHYLGDEPPILSTAMLVWQRVNKRDLTTEEIQKILVSNKLNSK